MTKGTKTKTFNKIQGRPLVFVGLSGGVDSSVSAALLQKQGYEVVGVFIKVWQPDFIECTWKNERRDAMRVAAHLGIPFLTMDLQKEYKRGVADYMISEYRAGRTPNPDVMCNKEVKFGAFFKKARAMGADFVATGHYARNDFDTKKGKWTMKKGKDVEKDQSYFLWTLDQKKLPYVLFPVGGLAKPAVRKLAKQFGLPTAAKKDSQGVCFLGKLDMKDFLSHYIKPKKGAVLDTEGNRIGSHSGAVFYTIGERHGFIITNKGIHERPRYIIAKDIKKNTITVTERLSTIKTTAIYGNRRNRYISSSAMAENEIYLTECNWVSGNVPVFGTRLEARSRYRQVLDSCEIVRANKGTALVKFYAPQPTASSGQSMVIYDGDTCLGGGVIM